MATDYTGLSFPIRLGSRGGLLLSSLNENSVAHVEESMAQILLTYKMERPMETHFYSSLDSFVFSKIEEAEETMLKYFIIEALKLEPRVKVVSDNISIIEAKEGTLRVLIRYALVDFGTEHSFEIDLKGGSYETT